LMKIPYFSNYPGRLRAVLLLASDMLGLMFSIWMAFYLYKQFGGRYPMTRIWRLWPIPVMVAGLGLASRIYLGNIFYPGLPINPVDELRRHTLSILSSYTIFFAFLTFTRENTALSRVALMLALILSLLLLPWLRAMLRHILWQLDIEKIPTLIMGNADFVAATIARMKKDKFNILNPVGTVSGAQIGDLPNYHPEKISSADIQLNAKYLIYCLGPGYPINELKNYIHKFHRILIVGKDLTYPILRAKSANFYRHFAFETGNCLRRPGAVLCKRIIEFIFSLAAMFFAIIPMIVLAALVKISSRGPVFYRAKRLGRNGKNIYVLKFRTMHPDADDKLEQLLAENPEMKKEWEQNFKLDNDPRITPVGRLLRRTSLDELPQFWNVLKGEMALIGPRPIVEAEVEYYGEHYEIFSSVKPGITGLWQVSGRSDTGYDERVALDVYYINNWSPWMDYYIFFATIREILLQRGAK